LNNLANPNMILFEHRFWLQVLGDHSRFIFDDLSPREAEQAQKAKHFIQLFDNLLMKARQELSPEEINQLTAAAHKAAQDIRDFKLNLIQQHLIEKININLSPSFLNHMVNEVEEYLYILCRMMQNKGILDHPIHHHLLWLLDGSGHAYAITAELDIVEKELKKISENFAKDFDNLYLKAVEIWGYMRTGLQQFPAVGRLNNQTEAKMELFKKFLTELETLIRENRILGTLQPLLLDHMYREECYFLTKLAMVSEVKTPECDPTKPRQE
jgi:hypothetical protein